MIDNTRSVYVLLCMRLSFCSPTYHSHLPTYLSQANEDRELGMKAALAAAAFGNFDPDKNGVIEIEDIARVFGHMKMDGLDADKVVP